MKPIAQIAAALVLGLSIGAALPAGGQAQDNTYVASEGQAVVRVAQGQLMGFQDRGVYTFHGVPYAKAARFMPPTAPDSWTGVRLAMNYGELCPVPETNQVTIDEEWNPHSSFPQNENCQTLNIWSPTLSPTAKRPVVVFIHGGGFTNGSSMELAGYDGHNLANLGGVVFVSMNHRLNSLGALDLTAFGPKYAQASNAGMRDVQASLQWIQANIAQFGGDPSNVTIVGQSGGGGKVRILMGIPSARNLFAREVIMSGASAVGPTYPKAVATAIAKHTVENLGLTADTIDKIQTVPYAQLEAAAEKAMKQTEADGLAKGIQWRPTVDGTFIPVDPQADGWAAYAADKPLLIGNVMEEMNTVLRNPNTPFYADNWAKWSDATAMQKLTAKYGAKAPAIAAAWKKAYPRDPLARVLMFADATRDGTIDAADLKASHGKAPVYVYLYKWNPPVLDHVAGAWHVADMQLAFYNADRMPQSFGGGEAARSMSFTMARAMINFARGGDPNHSGLPDWPAYTPANHATLLFDDYSTVGINHDKDLLGLMQQK